MKERIIVYWSRRDFRLSDNPALFSAVNFSKKEGIPLLPIFILEDYMVKGGPDFGYPSQYVLSKALPLFSKNFLHFYILRGKAAQTIIKLSQKFDITVFVNEDVYPDFYTQIYKIRDAGVEVKLYSDAVTISKETKTGSGNIYSVFTPFKNAVWSEFCSARVLTKVDLSTVTIVNESFKGFSLLQVDEQTILECMSENKCFEIGGIVYDTEKLLGRNSDYSNWYFDEESALGYFDSFLKHKMEDYKIDRDSLDREGTSRMSLALAWGLVSARLLRQKIQKFYKDDFLNPSTNQNLTGPTHYISELIWREFYKYLLYHNPTLLSTEFQQKFRGSITWVDRETAHQRFSKWIQGTTGYPIVDAAMMELAKTGYMHNRARMIVASVLTKNFGVDWRWGQEYFRAMLIDLDEASNSGGWQWGASVGADPKPIRIFNPYLQAENYDKEGLYQKKFLPQEYFNNPPEVLIEHKDARNQALKRYGLDDKRDSTVRDY